MGNGRSGTWRSNHVERTHRQRQNFEFPCGIIHDENVGALSQGAVPSDSEPYE